jgi:DNA polymerase bacteriophage-type
MTRILHIDYETRSECNLIKEGAYRYATHPSTEIICMGWAFDDDPVQVWVPGRDPFPYEVLDHIKAGVRASCHAHNAAFERLITNHVLLAYPSASSLEAWYCTAAQARSRSLPGSLDDLGRCLGLAKKKDPRGKELIKLLCIPYFDENGQKAFRDDPDLLEEMYEYCRRDVEVEREAAKLTPPLTDAELAAYHACERINDRGLKVDVEFALAAIGYADDERADICRELSRITNGQIESPQQYQRIKEWMAPYMDANGDIRKAMTRVETDRQTGEEKRRISLDSDARRRIMDMDDVPFTVLDLVDLVDEAGKSSIHKYRNMAARASDDDRVRGAYIFAGAGQTGRFSSVGLQVHNFPRKTADNPEQVRADVLENYEIDEPLETLAGMLRPSIMADDGHVFVCGDWSAIEARVLPWLTDSEGGRAVLDVFRTNDADASLPDIYMVEAGRFYGKPATEIDKVERQTGKVIVLSTGYQGGVRAFQSMARNYRVEIDDETARRIVGDWRFANPWAVDLWQDMENAAVNAVLSPGDELRVGRLVYCRPDDRPSTPLYCLLPSGRPISYPQPRVGFEEGRFGSRRTLSAVKAAWRPAQGETEWPRVQLYGGLLAENATQAAASDVLRDTMVEIDGLDWPIAGHTHDEILLEVREGEADEALAMLQEEMERGFTWSEGLPLVAECWTGKRYRK